LLFCSCRSSEYKLDTDRIDTGDDVVEDTGSHDTAVPLVDEDGDGYDETTDCDDENPLIYPGAEEVCDGVDNNCNSETDEPSAVDAQTWFADSDGDGHGDPLAATPSCPQPSGFVADNTDCDDTSTSTHPGALEVCDGSDNDCDGTVDEPDSVGASTYFADTDSDGFGDPASTTVACTPPTGFVNDDTDCDDTDASTYPGAPEYCDGVDHDCDGAINEVDSVDASDFYLDYDSDGFGNAAATTTACSAPSGYLTDSSDCNDVDAATYPGAPEICDGADNSCDGTIDELLTGSGAACPGTSCLNVLEDGSPTNSGNYWIDPDGSGAFQEYCDYGTVGSSWAYRVDFTIENATGDHLYEQQVALTLDNQQLITDGKMQSNSADLRFFTHDGPLLSYWYDTSTLPSAATVVWLVLPEIAANSTVNHTLTYGNPDTEPRSLAWHFDEFESDTSADYALHFDPSWDTPEFLWNTTTEQLETDNSNLDYFLQVSALTVSEPIYVEIQGRIFDNDSIGPMIRESDGTFLTAIACNDYDGAGHRDGQEAIVAHASAPTDYYEGSYVLALGDLVDPSSTARVGLFYDGNEAHYYLNGNWRGSAMRTATPTGAGLASFASSGTPGAEYEYLWVGSDPIDFDPHLRGSQATATLGSEAGF